MSETHEGLCPICGPTTFVIEGPWLRETYFCTRCRSIPRFRALIHVMEKRFPGWRRLMIHESSPAGAASDKLMCECPGYSFSHYFPDVAPGHLRGNVRCEDIERLTFPNNTFDIFITQDVMEHVFDVAVAFREIMRVLRPGGAYVFTVPCYRRDETLLRAARGADGVVTNVLPPMYHGNPVDSKGSLVVREWGMDIVDFIRNATGLEAEIINFNDRQYGLGGEFLDVIIIRKSPTAQSLDEMVRLGEAMAAEDRLDEALRCFEETLKSISGVRGTVLNNIAVIRFGKGMLDEAELLLNEAIREGNPEAPENLSRLRETRKSAGL